MQALRARGTTVQGTSRSADGGPAVDLSVDLNIPGLGARAVHEFRPTVVFLAAALTAVDGCEADPELARRVNGEAPGEIALACQEVGARLVHYSTDYIFDGMAGPYDEESVPAPLNVYGRSKLAGEERIRMATPDNLIVRTSGVFGWDTTSRNFAMQVWRNLSSGERMRVPADQVGNPTLAEYLAGASIRLADLGTTGTINVVGRDRIPRSEFARRLARAFGLDSSLIDAVPTGSLHQRAARPLEGGLTTQRLDSILGTQAMPLAEALGCLQRQFRAVT